MGSAIRRAACALSLALAGVVAMPALAHADECPVGSVERINGVCSPDPTPSPDPEPTEPEPGPEPTHTPPPRGTRTPKPPPRTTPPPVSLPTTRPQPTQTVALPTDFPTKPWDYPTMPEGLGYPTGEDRPTFPTGPGLAAAPSESRPQGSGFQIFTLLVAAGGIAFMLIRARVRRWMIGI